MRRIANRPTGCLPSEVLATHNCACIAGRSSGLRTLSFEPISTNRSFPIFLRSVPNTAFVFAYRCGAALDFNQVPY